MTPHNEAKIGDIAKNVIMPGDPLRAKYIAENFLENPRLVNSIRGMYAYTGTYKGKAITVFPSGMGIPSLGIYSYELYKFYDVQNIIRIGSCGAYYKYINLLDIILVNKSYATGSFALELTGTENHIIESSSKLNNAIKEAALKLELPMIEGNSMCSEVFGNYCNVQKFKELYPQNLSILTMEMEAFALFTTAKSFNRNASCLLTVVDSPYTYKTVSPKERERSLNPMIKLALESSEDM